MDRILYPVFNEFTSGCTQFFKQVKINNLQNLLHI